MKLNDSVSSLMTSAPKSIDAGATLLEVKHFFEAREFHHHLPVVEGGKLVGMVSLYDFLIAKQGASFDNDEAIYTRVRVKDFMRTPPISVSPDTTLEKALSLFINETISALPVVEGEKMVGILTSNDILRALLSANQ
jgi:acetoin utilization protein AcuB